LKERYEYSSLTHPDFDMNLWLKTRSFDGPNKNQVYGFSNTTTENLWITRSALNVGCSQLVSSTQTLEFVAMLNQRVQAWTTHLHVKCKWLTTDYEEFYRLIMKMKSQMDDTCYPLIGSMVQATTGLLLLLLLQCYIYFRFIVFEQINV
jgi:hypothetical protein